MIRADVIYTGEYLRDSYLYNNRKYRRRTIAVSIAGIIVLVLLALWALRYLKYEEFSTLVRIALLVNVFSVYSNIKKIIKLLRQGSELEKTPPAAEKREFFFDDDRFTFVKREALCETRREFAYRDLHAATETNKYFFVHLQKNVVCIIGKNDITEGTASQLRELFIRKMTDQFLIDTEGSI